MTLRTLSRIAKRLELLDYQVAEMIGMPGRTFARARVLGRLSPSVSDRLVALSAVIDAVVRKFSGDNEQVRQWLVTSNRSLKDERPIDHLQTEVGRSAVGRALLEASGSPPAPGLFLSHNWNDKPFARRLALDLGNLGAKVWLDEVEMKVGDSLIEAIRAAIDRMNYLAVVLSPNSVQSEWVKREVDIAMNQEIEGKRIKVLPLMYQQCELPGFLKGKLYADFRSEDRYSKGLEMIAKRLGLQVLQSVASSRRRRLTSASTRARRKRRAG